MNKSIKEVIYKKYNNKCVVCGSVFGSTSRKTLIVHHIDGEEKEYSDRKNDNIDNLILLCVSCHRRLHTLAKENKKLGKRLTVIRDEIINSWWDTKYNGLSMEEIGLLLKLSIAQVWRIIHRNKNNIIKVEKKTNKNK